MDLVAIEYNGVIYFVTEQEYSDLMNGYLSVKDMFE